MHRHSRCSMLFLALAVVGLLLQPNIGHSSDWLGGSASWSSNANPGWNGTGVPNAVGAIANHGVATSTTTTQNTGVAQTVGTISQTNNSNNSWTITNTNGLILNQDGAGAGVATISNTNTDTNASALVINSGTITLADNLLITNTGSSSNATGAIQIASVIAGTGNITLSNNTNSLTTRALRIQNSANTFTGSVLVQKGTTTFNNSASFGNSANVITLGESGMGAATLVSTATLVNLPNNIVVASGSGGTLTLGSTSTALPTFSGNITLNGDLSITSASVGTSYLTFSGAISGAGKLTKVGTGNAILTNTTSSYGGGTFVDGGGLVFDTAAAIVGAGANVTANSGGAVAPNYALDNAFLGRIVTTSAGVIALGTDSSNALDFSPFGTASLGSIGSFNYTGTLTPNASTYRLGGGGGTLTLPNANLLTSSNNLVVTANGTSAASVVVLSANNNYTGTTSVAGNGILSIADINDVGVASPIGTPALAQSVIDLSGGGTLRYSAATNDSTNRVFNAGTGGGKIEVSNAAATLSITNFTGAGVLSKIGPGTLAFPNVVNATGNLEAAAGVTTFTGTGSDNTIGALSHSGTSSVNIPTGVTLAVGSFASTLNTSGTLTFTGGGTLKMNAPTQSFVVGNRNTAADFVSTVDASALNTFDVSALNFRVAQSSTSLAEEVVGVLNLPTAVGSTSKITTAAAGTLSVGSASDNGAPPFDSTLNLGGGTNTIVTNTITIGAAKMGGIIQFPAASAGSLTLNGVAGGSVAITMGSNTTSTATDPISKLDFTTTGSVSGAIGTLSHGAVNSSSTGTSTNTFTLAAAGGGTVTINTIQFGTLSGTTPASTMTVNIGGTSTLQFNAAGTGFVLGTSGTAPTRTATINISGGTLAMAGKDIYSAASVGTVNSTLNLTSGTLSNAGTIGNLTNLTFSGGTFLNSSVVAQAINRAVAQTSTTGNSLLQINGGQATTITGTYTVDGGANTASVIVNGTLNATSVGVGVTSAAKLSGAGTVGSPTTIGAFGTVAPGNSIGTLALSTGLTIDGTYLLETAAGSQADLLNVTGALTLNTLSSVLDLDALSTLVPTETYVIANYTSLTGTFFNVDSAITTTHTVDYTTGNQIRLVPTVIPEPGTLALAALGAVGLLVVRRRRVK